MCGICGYYNWRGSERASREVLERMAWSLRHRGPDGVGFHLDGPLGLAHRRLAPVDAEDAGGRHQPISSRDGRVRIACDGEIYNLEELAAELRARGHAFRAGSVPEAVLLAYREWGLEFPRYLNGAFAIAVWDEPARRLVLCRDRMGVKPLYHAVTASGVAFASEIKALRALPGVARELDLESLGEYMACGHVAHPRTMVRGVEKVPPGAMVVVEPDRGAVKRCYWRLVFHPERDHLDEEWIEEIRERFTDAVRVRVPGNLPTGVLLSGGLDASLIAATAAQVRGEPGSVSSFCVGLDVPGARGQLRRARQVAAQLGLRHHEQHLTWEQYGEALLDAVRLVDEPVAEPAMGQLLAACRLARQHAGVVLSGEGADETWLGDPAYQVQCGLALLHRLLPARLRLRLAPSLDSVAGAAAAPMPLARLARLAAAPLGRHSPGPFEASIAHRLLAPPVRARLAARTPREDMRRLHARAGGPDPLSRMAAADCRTRLVDSALLRSDLVSTATSIELRAPFLDHRLVELAARIPGHLKVLPHAQKVILRRALAGRLPRAARQRRAAGSPAPLAELFRSDWGRRAQEMLARPSSGVAELLDRARLHRMMEEHRAGRADWSRVLLQVLVLEHWNRDLARPAETPLTRQDRVAHAYLVPEQPVQHSAGA